MKRTALMAFVNRDGWSHHILKLQRRSLQGQGQSSKLSLWAVISVGFSCMNFLWKSLPAPRLCLETATHIHRRPREIIVMQCSGVSVQIFTAQFSPLGIAWRGKKISLHCWLSSFLFYHFHKISSVLPSLECWSVTDSVIKIFIQTDL